MENYPIGASNDSRAPYNQHDYHNDKADDIIYLEIDTLDEYFAEWVGEYCSDYDGKEDWTDYLKRKAQDENVRESYHNYRYYDVAATLEDDEPDFSDDAYEIYREMNDD